MTICWIALTIGKHVVAQEALAGGDEGVGVEETAESGVIISTLQIVKLGFGVVDIATVAQGVEFSQGGS